MSSEGDDNNSDSRPPISPYQQIEAAFELAEKQRDLEEFRWLIDYLHGFDDDTEPDVRLVQFSVYGDRNYWVYIVLHLPSSEFGELAQALETNDVRVPYQIRVLSRYYGSQRKIDVCITWGPGGGS